MAPERDGDGQPTHLVVGPTAGEHVAESDAEWVWERLNAPATMGREALASRVREFAEECRWRAEQSGGTKRPGWMHIAGRLDDLMLAAQGDAAPALAADWLAEHDREVAAGALRTKATAYRNLDRAGYLFLSGPDRPDHVPWEAVARDLDADAARIARGQVEQRATLRDRDAASGPLCSCSQPMEHGRHGHACPLYDEGLAGGDRS